MTTTPEYDAMIRLTNGWINDYIAEFAKDKERECAMYRDIAENLSQSGTHSNRSTEDYHTWAYAQQQLEAANKRADERKRIEL